VFVSYGFNNFVCLYGRSCIEALNYNSPVATATVAINACGSVGERIV
jgi:hypothetical protein